jgi:hypothetical protein
VTVQKHFIADYKCREAVKLFRFPLSPYTLRRSCSNVQNCAFHTSTEIRAEGGCVNLCTLPEGHLCNKRHLLPEPVEAPRSPPGREIRGSHGCGLEYCRLQGQAVCNQNFPVMTTFKSWNVLWLSLIHLS